MLDLCYYLYSLQIVCILKWVIYQEIKVNYLIATITVRLSRQYFANYVYKSLGVPLFF